MINFEQEIEERLRYFQWLNGKGNVKDCNHTLYEIIRLMLGMIRSTHADDTPVAKPTPSIDLPSVPPPKTTTAPHAARQKSPSSLGLTKTGQPRQRRAKNPK